MIKNADFFEIFIENVWRYQKKLELIERLIQNLHSLLVISFSVINYVVSMRVRT